jgi:hypothetical protein
MSGLNVFLSHIQDYDSYRVENHHQWGTLDQWVGPQTSHYSWVFPFQEGKSDSVNFLEKAEQLTTSNCVELEECDQMPLSDWTFRRLLEKAEVLVESP